MLEVTLRTCFTFAACLVRGEQQRDLVDDRNREGVGRDRALPLADLVARRGREHHRVQLARAVGPGLRDRGLRDRRDGVLRELAGGGESPRAVHQRADADAVGVVVAHALHDLVARVDVLLAARGDAHVGVRRAGTLGDVERDLHELARGGIAGRRPGSGRGEQCPRRRGSARRSRSWRRRRRWSSGIHGVNEPLAVPGWRRVKVPWQVTPLTTALVEEIHAQPSRLRRIFRLLRPLHRARARGRRARPPARAAVRDRGAAVGRGRREGGAGVRSGKMDAQGSRAAHVGHRAGVRLPDAAHRARRRDAAAGIRAGRMGAAFVRERARDVEARARVRRGPRRDARADGLAFPRGVGADGDGERAYDLGPRAGVHRGGARAASCGDHPGAVPG